ncbi:acetylglutamate kinase [Myroides sp. LJL116]
MQQKITVVKIGGNIVDDAKALEDFLDIYAQIPGKKILVHGGGKLATKMANDLDLPTTMIQGRRVTCDKMLPITVMVYAGLINTTITALLQKRKCDAIGLNGSDAAIITASKRPIDPVDFGFVGDFQAKDVNVKRIEQLLDLDLYPVFCAITADQNGQLLNTNADTIASNLSIALAQDYSVDLIYCFEHKGVLIDIKDPNSVISNINSSSFTSLLDKGIVKDGMVPKIQNALVATKQGVSKVCIKLAQDLLDPAQGTTIEN